MRALPCIVVAALAGCGSEPTVAPPVEPPAIETASAPPATATPAPVAAPTAVPPPATAPLPASLSSAQVEKTFAHHRRYFERLYNAHRQAQPKLGGTILVSFAVTPEGSAQAPAIVESTVGDRGFEQAVLRQIEQMTFPPAAGPTPVERFPLQFSAARR